MTNNNDFIIDNDAGQQVRLDIQDALQQLASNNFGTIPPVTNVPNEAPVQIAYPHQWFANGNTGKLMYKDASDGNDANTNYFNLANLTGGLFVDQASTFNGDVVFNANLTATAQPACLLIDPVDTTITSTNESTPIKFTTQETNVGCTVNNDKDRITVPSSGTYLISVCLSGIKTNATSDTERILKILKNGNDAVDKNAFPRDPFGTSRTNESFSHTITMPLVLSEDDYLELCFEGVHPANATVKFGYFSVTKLY